VRIKNHGFTLSKPYSGTTKYSEKRYLLLSGNMSSGTVTAATKSYYKYAKKINNFKNSEPLT